MANRTLYRLCLIVTMIWIGGCVSPEMAASITTQETQPPTPFVTVLNGDAYPTPSLEGSTRERREVEVRSDGAVLAGELDLPVGEGAAPLVFIIHHSGPVTRDAYGYLAELLTQAGNAVFRFDKRGVGRSSGEYGCCEPEDALAAYQAAVAEPGIDRTRVFIVAQSIGTEHLADHFEEFAAIQQPHGVVLLSSLLGPERITQLAAPVHIIVSDSESNLDGIGEQAAAAHAATLPYGASYYVAEGTEHTLFDSSEGPIDWGDPDWVTRYHRGAMNSMIAWLNSRQND